MPRPQKEPRRFSGVALRHQRQGAYLSVTELGFRIGRSADTIRAYEAGATVPPGDIVPALVHALGCSFNDLYIHDESGLTA